MSGRSAIRIDLSSQVPAYRQIADAIRQLLVAREIRPGEQLPTVRRLAIDLAVHHNTVAEAYRLLSDEGWLDLKRRRGALVLERSRPRASAKERGALKQRLRGLIAEMRTAGLPLDTIRAEFDSIARRLVGEPEK
jgi:DNA-binding transcriptional regulator YhcF (GntR family)